MRPRHLGENYSPLPERSKPQHFACKNVGITLWLRAEEIKTSHEKKRDNPVTLKINGNQLN